VRIDAPQEVPKRRAPFSHGSILGSGPAVGYPGEPVLYKGRTSRTWSADA
jgi:hypothetical protein